MNIRKIIKEEVDSFDWVEDIGSFSPALEHHSIERGMRVYIHPESRFWYDTDDRKQKWWSRDEDNPLDELGTVEDFDSTTVDVLWDNGNYTSYTYNDLEQENPSNEI